MMQTEQQIWDYVSDEISGLMISAYFHYDLDQIQGLKSDIQQWRNVFWDSYAWQVTSSDLNDIPRVYLHFHDLTFEIVQQMIILMNRILRDCHLMIDPKLFMFDANLDPESHLLTSDDLIVLDGTSKIEDFYELLARCQMIYQVNVPHYQQQIKQYLYQVQHIIQIYAQTPCQSVKDVKTQLKQTLSQVMQLKQHLIQHYGRLMGLNGAGYYQVQVHKNVHQLVFLDKVLNDLQIKLDELDAQQQNLPSDQRSPQILQLIKYGQHVIDMIENLDARGGWALGQFEQLWQMFELDSDYYVPQIERTNGLLVTKNRIMVTDPKTSQAYWHDVGSCRIFDEFPYSLCIQQMNQFWMLKWGEREAIMQQQWQDVNESDVPQNVSFCQLLQKFVAKHPHQYRDDTWLLLTLQSDNLFKVGITLKDVQYQQMDVTICRKPIKMYQKKMKTAVLDPLLANLKQVGEYLS